MWSQETYWNPLFFVGTWTGAAIVMYSFGRDGYPGWRRHLALAAVSVPLWWWFELANARVGNWHYITLFDYSPVVYALLASLAFSTVVPALDSAWRMYIGPFAPRGPSRDPGPRRAYRAEVVAGLLAAGLMLWLPGHFFPLVWVAPFLILDGLVGHGGGRNLALELFHGQWRLAAAVGLAGLTCGVLWEFWNFWATPRWVYDIPYLEFWHAFEMPVLGYAGYVPFAWSAYQLTRLKPLARYLSARG